MKVFSVTQSIRATPETLWTILTDAPQYPAWDPNMDRIEGRIAPGERIKVFTKLSPGRAFPATVTTFESPHKMVWTGGMPLGLFKGERTFTLTPEDDGTTTFSMQEAFSGLLFPLIGRTIPDLNPSFEGFAAGLKARAEAAV